MILWPTTIPIPIPVAPGAPLHPVIASPLTSAFIERRLRFAGSSPIALDVTWILSIAQYNAFKIFFLETLYNGSAVFALQLRHPKLTTLTEWQVKFIGDYQAAYQEGLWSVTAKIDLLLPTAIPPIAPRINHQEFLVLPSYVTFVTSDSSDGDTFYVLIQ